MITNSSNNYGPYHFPEKFIPLIILNALDSKDLLLYGKGDQIRDLLYIADHVTALYKVITEGSNGETYNIGGHNDKQNIEVVRTVYQILDKIQPQSYESLITFITDRPGHNLRYAINANNSLGWTPDENFDTSVQNNRMVFK